ncbi:hypothetical protein HVS_00435 [Acetivibrio saccincola]|jgi:uncharacterized lipoprotein YehR (DUF1307 family)|uniref:DUF3221 domain-containing protein n=2 Tax=Acetivibrio saccincola TaxID=1677857 RepID=A0A2K9EHU2_9FIRM|nr:hypothetical protein HVS_00435 [Acetivibrio saccincola]
MTGLHFKIKKGVMVMKLKKISLILIGIILVISMSACSNKHETDTISGTLRNISFDDNNQAKHVFLTQYLEESDEYATFAFSVSEKTKFLNSSGESISPDSLEEDVKIEIVFYKTDAESFTAEAAEIRVLD